MLPFTFALYFLVLEIEENMKKLLRNIYKSVVKIYICDIITNVVFTENSNYTAF